MGKLPGPGGFSRSVTCLQLLALATALHAQDAGAVFKQARQAERSGEMARAYLLYSQAALLDPQKKLYWLHSQAVRSRAALQARVKPPAGPPEDPAPEIETPPAEDRQPLPPIQLHASNARKDLDLRGDAKTLWEQTARAFGLDVVFDGDFQPGQDTRFRMGAADYREALNALGLATGTFAVPVSEKLILIAKDTQQKRQEVEPVVSVSIPIPELITVQEAQEMAQAVRQVMQFAKFQVDAGKRILVLRDTQAKVVPAIEVLRDLMSRRAVVDIELEFIEINRSDSLTYGLRLPSSFPVTSLSTILNNVPTSAAGAARLLRLAGGHAAFGIGVADAAIAAQMSRSNAHTLLRTQLRSLDGMPATFHVGDRYPILTGGYFGPIDTPGQVFTPPPQFNFEDLGVSFKVTPRVHDGEEVTLEVEAEFKVLGGQSFNGIPVISNRKAVSRARLRTGEWAVIAGMMNATEARTFSGIAGLASLPGIGALLRKNQRDRSTSEVVVVLKPRILGLPATEFVTQSIRTGSDSKPYARY